MHNKISLLILAGLFIGCGTKKAVVHLAPQATPEDPVAAFGLPLEKTPDTVVSMKPVYFNTDSAGIKPSEYQNLDSIVEFLKVNKVEKVKLYGHCDERGSRQYNYSLGRLRVKAIALYLNRKLNFPSFELHSLGEDSPLCTEPTDRCWAQNRRVEIVAVIP